MDLWYNCSVHIDAWLVKSQVALAGIQRARKRILGVIDSLSAGYRHLRVRPYLLIIPVLLDLLLWLAPRLSIATLLAQVADSYNALARWQNVSPDWRPVFTQMAQAMNEAGQQSNLLQLLASSSLLQVPSLLLAIRPFSASSIQQIASLWAVASLSGLIGLGGLLVGVLYLHWLAQSLPIGAGAKHAAPGQEVRLLLRQWLVLAIFVFFAFGGLLLLLAMISLGASVIALISPGLGSVVAFVLVGMVLVVMVYLYFVPAGLIMDNLPLFHAIGQSFRLVRDNFSATLGLILLMRLISWGVMMILERLFVYQTFGILAAILINAYIGSGLALGWLVFYRSRLLVAAGQTVNYEL